MYLTVRLSVSDALIWAFSMSLCTSISRDRSAIACMNRVRSQFEQSTHGYKHVHGYKVANMYK